MRSCRNNRIKLIVIEWKGNKNVALIYTKSIWFLEIDVEEKSTRMKNHSIFLCELFVLSFSDVNKSCFTSCQVYCAHSNTIVTHCKFFSERMKKSSSNKKRKIIYSVGVTIKICGATMTFRRWHTARTYKIQFVRKLLISIWLFFINLFRGLLTCVEHFLFYRTFISSEWQSEINSNDRKYWHNLGNLVANDQ